VTHFDSQITNIDNIRTWKCSGKLFFQDKRESDAVDGLRTSDGFSSKLVDLSESTSYRFSPKYNGYSFFWGGGIFESENIVERSVRKGELT
jgi:hypothetical protein